MTRANGRSSAGSRMMYLSGPRARDHEPEVEIRQLRHFVGLAEELHFGRAANRLYITQPGLSQSIAKLERALDVRLLQRSRQGVELTDAGLEFLGYARRTLAEMESTLERIRSVGNGQAGVLRTGVALLADQAIAPALAAFGTKHPGVVLDRTAAVSERLLTQVGEGSLHVAIVHQIPALTTLPRVRWEVVRRGRLAVLIGARHRLARRPQIALSQLSAETFLVNPRELAPSALQGLKLMCAEFGGFDPKVAESGATSAPTLDADWQPVRQGEVVAIMAEETARWICPDGVAVVPLRPPPLFVLAAAWREGGQSPLLDRFLGFLREYRDRHAWTVDTPQLSTSHQDLLDAR